MRLLKQFLLILALFPLLSFASSYPQKDYAMDATFTKVSPGCYRIFKTMFGMLPDLAATKGIGISHVKTPSGNPSTFTLTVDYSPSGLGVGDYALYQKYSDKHKELYLRLDQYAETFPVEDIDDLWIMLGKGLEACGMIED